MPSEPGSGEARAREIYLQAASPEALVKAIAAALTALERERDNWRGDFTEACRQRDAAEERLAALERERDQAKARVAALERALREIGDVGHWD